MTFLVTQDFLVAVAPERYTKAFWEETPDHVSSRGRNMHLKRKKRLLSGEHAPRPPERRGQAHTSGHLVMAAQFQPDTALLSQLRGQAGGEKDKIILS